MTKTHPAAALPPFGCRPGPWVRARTRRWFCVKRIAIDWDDFSELSDVVPLLARIYPNGSADVNHFHAAGGMGFLVRELLKAGLMHSDVQTIAGLGLEAYTQEPWLSPAALAWREAPVKRPD